jgi:hypothetical protein
VRRLGLAVACGLLAVSIMAVTPAFAVTYKQSYPFVTSHSVTDIGTGLQPWGIAVGADSSVYVAGDTGYATKLGADWTAVTYPGLGLPHIWDSGDSPLDEVRGVATLGTDLWLLDYSNGAAKFNTNGHFQGTVITSAVTPIMNPTGIAMDASAAVYVADNNGGGTYGFRVSKFTPDGVYTGIQFGDIGPHPMLSVQAVAVGPDFTVYVGDSIAQKIWRYRPTDALRSTYTYVGFWQNDLYDNPTGLACAPDGSVFVLDDDTKSMTKLAADGTPLAHFGGPGDAASQFYIPRAIALAPNGHLYATDGDKKTALEFQPLDLGPSTQAYAAVTVKKGKTASFKYRVFDELSSSVNVTIKIYKGSSLKKTISCGRVSQGSWRTKTWKDTLAKGTYTWKVYASDLTGHAQRNVASKTFKVK